MSPISFAIRRTSFFQIDDLKTFDWPIFFLAISQGWETPRVEVKNLIMSPADIVQKLSACIYQCADEVELL